MSPNLPFQSGKGSRGLGGLERRARLKSQKQPWRGGGVSPRYHHRVSSCVVTTVACLGLFLLPSLALKLAHFLVLFALIASTCPVLPPTPSFKTLQWAAAFRCRATLGRRRSPGIRSASSCYFRNAQPGEGGGGFTSDEGCWHLRPRGRRRGRINSPRRACVGC